MNCIPCTRLVGLCIATAWRQVEAEARPRYDIDGVGLWTDSFSRDYVHSDSHEDQDDYGDYLLILCCFPASAQN